MHLSLCKKNINIKFNTGINIYQSYTQYKIFCCEAFWSPNWYFIYRILWTSIFTSYSSSKTGIFSLLIFSFFVWILYSDLLHEQDSCHLFWWFFLPLKFRKERILQLRVVPHRLKSLFIDIFAVVITVKPSD